MIAVLGGGGDDGGAAGQGGDHAIFNFGDAGVTAGPGHRPVGGIIGGHRGREGQGVGGAVVVQGRLGLAEGHAGDGNCGGRHGHCTGGGFAAVLCGDSDGGGAFLQGCDEAVGHRGNGFVTAGPRHVFIGGIVRLYRGGELGGVAFRQCQAVFVKRHAGDRDGIRWTDFNAKFPAIATVGIGGRHGKSARCHRGGSAGNHTAIIQGQASRQGTAGDAPCDRRGAGCRQRLAVRCPFGAVWQANGCDGGSMIDHTLSTDIARQGAGVVDGAVVGQGSVIGHSALIGQRCAATNRQARPAGYIQALVLADGQILLQGHTAVHGALVAVKNYAA